VGKRLGPRQVAVAQRPRQLVQQIDPIAWHSRRIAVERG